MLSTWIQSKKDEEGFTLIELLVVVIIIGILAAIAIPVFLNQRENAWRSAVQSDLRNAAIEMETVFTTAQAYPAALPATVQTSTGVTILLDGSSAGQQYCLTGSHANLGGTTIFVMDSDAGGLRADTDCTP